MENQKRRIAFLLLLLVTFSSMSFYLFREVQQSRTVATPPVDGGVKVDATRQTTHLGGAFQGVAGESWSPPTTGGCDAARESLLRSGGIPGGESGYVLTVNSSNVEAEVKGIRVEVLGERETPGGPSISCRTSEEVQLRDTLGPDFEDLSEDFLLGFSLDDPRGAPYYPGASFEEGGESVSLDEGLVTLKATPRRPLDLQVRVRSLYCSCVWRFVVTLTINGYDYVFKSSDLTLISWADSHFGVRGFVADEQGRIMEESR